MDDLSTAAETGGTEACEEDPAAANAEGTGEDGEKIANGE